MIKLNEFITESLNQIIDGVADAQTHAVEKKASINPKGLRHNVIGNQEGFVVETEYQVNRIPQIIDFEVLVTVTEGGEAKGGIGVFTGAINLGTQAKATGENVLANKIKFSIPVVFPEQPPNG